MLASHNQGKLAEFEALLEGTGIELVSAAALGLAEPDETADSFAGNARLKAHAAARAADLPALADDSGFCVGALDGAARHPFGALGRATAGFHRRDAARA